MRAEQGADPAGLPDDGRVHDRVGFDGLERVHLHPGADHRLPADEALVADDDALVEAGVLAEVAVAADDRAAQLRAPPDVDVVVEHGPEDRRLGFHDDVGAEHGVLGEVRAGFDPRVVADDDRPVDAGVGVDLGAFTEPDAVAELEAADVDLDPAVEDVGVGPQVRLGGADVLPVAVGDVAVQRLTLGEHRGEHVAGEVDDLTFGDGVEDHRLEDVDAGVDGVREHLTPGRLLQEPFDAPVGSGDDDPELERVLDPLQRDRRHRAAVAVRLHERGEIEVGEDGTGDDEEGVVELGGRVADRPRGPERLLVGRVPHPDPEVGAVPEVGADLVGEVGDGDDHVVEAVLGEEPHDVLHHRLVDERHHRLGLVAGQGPQPGAFPTGEDDRLHAATRVRAARPSARAARANGT